MYIELAVLSLFIFSYSLFASRLEKTFISGPMFFVFAGIILGPLFLNLFAGDIKSQHFRVLADLTLALFLFIDSANANLNVLKGQVRIPVRMLLLGLPGVIVLGTLFAALLFDMLSIYEAAILGTMLAATDAALGKAVIVNEAVPSRLREGLNVESGLNDGLCVPILFVFIALAEGTVSEGGESSLAFHLVAEELGIGLLVGCSLSLVGTWLIRFFYKKAWLSKVWLQITIIMLAVSAFSVAQSLHGSGYIAAFTGGLLFGYLNKQATHKLVFAAEGVGETLALVTWLLFGAAVISHTISAFTWPMILYAFLSLTIVRMIPIFLSLLGTGESVSSKLFLGWFGPRGLASIVFAIIVVNKEIPGAKYIGLVVTLTVLLSLIFHGISAQPLAKLIGKKERST